MVKHGEAMSTNEPDTNSEWDPMGRRELFDVSLRSDVQDIGFEVASVSPQKEPRRPYSYKYVLRRDLMSRHVG